MILIDTHFLLWWTTGQHRSISDKAMTEFEHARQALDVRVSTMSMWETALLDSQRRIDLAEGFDAWRQKVEAMTFVEFIPIDNRIAVEANRLPDPFHRDPADRLIVATARVHRIPLVTADDRIRAYSGVETIW